MPPPFELTPRVLSTLSRIDQGLGRLKGLSVAEPQPLLRKRNHVRSIQASAAIEGNPLSVDQVTALLDGKRVLGSQKDLREILNVNEAYARLSSWRSTSPASLRSAHGLLMKDLMPDAGCFRTGGVGVFRGQKLTHLAPPAHLVAHQVGQVLRWLRSSKTPSLVAGCVVHYELLFIHPFNDGNGRLARLWQQVVHAQHSPLLRFVPVELIVRQRQRRYYDVLRKADRDGHCTRFLEFALAAVADGLDEFGTEVRPGRPLTADRLSQAKQHFGQKWFTRAGFLSLHVNVSAATASRDLAAGVAAKRLELRGTKRLAQYRFVNQ